MKAVDLSLNQNAQEESMEALLVSQQALDIVTALSGDTSDGFSNVSDFLNTFKNDMDTKLSSILNNVLKAITASEQRTNLKLELVSSSQDEIKQSLLDIGHKISISDDSIEALDGAVDRINHSISSLSQTVDNLKTTSSSTVASLSKINTAMLEIISLTNTTKNTLSVIKTDHDSIKNSILTNRGLINQNNTLVSSLFGETSDIKSDLHSIKLFSNRFDELDMSVSHLDSDVHYQTALITNSIMNLRKDNVDILSEIEEVKSQLVYPSTLNKLYAIEEIPTSMQLSDISDNILIGELNDTLYDMTDTKTIIELSNELTIEDISEFLLVSELK